MLSLDGHFIARGVVQRLRSRSFLITLALAPSAAAAVHSSEPPDSAEQPAPPPSPLFPGLSAPAAGTSSSTESATETVPTDTTPAPEPAGEVVAPPQEEPPRAGSDSSVDPGEADAANDEPPAPSTTGEELGASAPSAATQSATPTPCTANSEEEDPPSPFKSILLLEAVGRYGLLGRGSGLLDVDADEALDETFTAGYFGGQATFGLMPSHSAFTLAGRLRGGSYIGGGLAAGSLGAAVLFGANFARNETGDSFSYALGGFGVEFMPAANTDMLTFNASGGTIMNGFNLSAGLDLGINDDLFVAFFGLQLGWGQLFK